MKKLIFALILIPTFASANFTQPLSYGVSGNDVYQLQELLINEGCFTLNPTGYFGLITLKGVKCFQEKYGIESTGYFGILSRTAANQILDNEISISKGAQIKEEALVSVPSPSPTPTPQVIQTTMKTLSVNIVTGQGFIHPIEKDNVVKLPNAVSIIIGNIPKDDDYTVTSNSKEGFDRINGYSNGETPQTNNQTIQAGTNGFQFTYQPKEVQTVTFTITNKDKTISRSFEIQVK